MSSARSKGIRAGAAALAITFGVAGLSGTFLSLGTTAAFAQGKGQGSGQGGSGGSGGEGSQSGQGNAGQGQGQGGPSSDSEGKGPQAGAPAGTGGGKPVWAQEGIPEVELGRLSVARSPDKVLDQAFDEAVASLSPEMIAFYNLSLSDAIFQLSTNWDSITILDSPLQNLALLKDALDGTSVLSSKGVSNDNDTLLAIFLGVASDKTIPITTDTVIAVTTILGTPVTGSAAAELAADAEAIRVAVLAGHG